jgi:hypothetical protein
MNKQELIRQLLIIWDVCLGILAGKTTFTICEVITTTEPTYWTFSQSANYDKFESYEAAQRCMINTLIEMIESAIQEQLKVPADEQAYMNPSLETIHKLKHDLKATLLEAGYDIH